jgi:hypothetical protein
VLESGPTTQWHYSEESGFARLTERKWGLPAAATLRLNRRDPMRIYLIGNDGSYRKGHYHLAEQIAKAEASHANLS